MWSEWGGWGECSRSCSGGYQSRTRTCSNPEPTEYGIICPGNDTEYRRCNTEACSCKTKYLMDVREKMKGQSRIAIKRHTCMPRWVPDIERGHKDSKIKHTHTIYY